MSDIKPQYLANLMITECSHSEHPVKIDDAIYEVLCHENHNDLSEEARWEYVECYKTDIANELFRKKDDIESDGAPVSFDIEEDHGEYYVKFTNVIEIELLRKLRQISPSQFEVFCSNILEKMNGTASVSGGRDDNGIDFHATDINLFNMPSLSTLGSRVMVIGQAKRYKNGNHVKTKELKEFIGSSLLAMYEHKKDVGKAIGIMHPIILAFWTTSDFHYIAKQYARDMGLWYLNGLALCKLATEMGVNIEENTLIG